LIHLSPAILQGVFDVVVHVPAAAGDLNAAHAFLDQPTREQAALAEIVHAILLTQVLRLIGDAEGLQVVAAHDLDRVLVKLGVALHAGGLEAGAEAAVELVEQSEALAHDIAGDLRRGILQPRIGVQDRQRRE
jgi:hypothetical protein